MSMEEWTGYEVSESALEQAAQWIAMLDSNNLTDTDRLNFYSWLQQHPSHQSAFLELSELWAKSACINTMSELVERSSVIAFPTDMPTPLLPPTTADHQATASNTWTYTVAIALICVGLAVPLIQSL